MPADPAAILTALALANLAGGAGILIVVMLRRPIQRWVGPARASWLWLIPLGAAAASLLPARTVAVASLPAPIAAFAEAPVAETIDTAPAITPILPAEAAPTLPDLSALLLALWLCGAAAFLLATLLRQRVSLRRFGRLTREGDTLRAEADDEGPAVIGVIRPRLVTPANFETRFEPRERDMVLAHERTHITAQHTRINAVLALITAVNWFNPLIHWANRLVRADQELACDAAVAAKFPGERRIYAEALLKTQLAPASLPLGCTWPARSSSLLKERVMMLASKPPTRAGRLAGTGLICLAVLGCGLVAWAAKPARPSDPVEPVLSPFAREARPVAPDDVRTLTDEALVPLSTADLAGATITCNRWHGVHSRDHLVVWDEVKGDLAVTLIFTDHYDPKVSFPNDAFPKGVYPESVAYPRPGMNLRNPDRYVYQSVSESVVDTITIEGLSSGDLNAVWQRFRMDQEGVHSIVLQGGCKRS